MPWEQLFSVKIQWVIGVFIGLSLLLGWLLEGVLHPSLPDEFKISTHPFNHTLEIH